MIQYSKGFAFEAARQLSEQEGVGLNIHGHSFKLFVTLDSNETDDSIVFDTLEKRVAPVLKQMNYGFLNEVTALQHPSDSILLEWIQQELSDFSCEQLKLKQLKLLSTQNTGSILDSSGLKYAFHHFMLHSAHFLPHVPLGHKCGRLHGHNFGILLQWKFDSSETILNYEEIRQRFAPCYEQLNKKLLNDISGLENPTSENLSAWIWHQLKAENPLLDQVTVYETRSSGSTYDGKGWNCFKQFSMDGAIQGEDDLMGHTYEVRLYISGDVDTKLGWIVDFGDIKDSFKPYFKTLDHHALHEVEGMQAPTLANIAKWIAIKLSPSLPQLSQIEIWNTEYSGMCYDLGLNQVV